MMRKLAAAAALALGPSFFPVSAWAQPQPLPEAACNQGTEGARAKAPEPADSGIPHENRDGHCLHAVPSGG